MIARVLNVVSLCGLLIASTTQAGWTTGPELPSPIQEIYPTSWQGKLVVAGGLAGSADSSLMITDAVWKFDDQQWHLLTAFPEPRHHPMMMPVHDTLYAIGGFVESERGQWTNTADVMRLTQHGWQKRASMPVTLSETVAAAIDGKLHVAGGRSASEKANGRWSDSRDTDWHGVYDPRSDSWHSAPSLPLARNSACSTVVQGNWHVIGGRTVQGGNSDRHDIYYPDTQQWQSAPPLPEAQGGLACATLGGTIYVFGGEYFDNGGGVYKTVWAYDTAAEKWQKAGEMPVPRHGLGAVTIDGAIWVIGGAAKAGANETSDKISIYRP